MSDDERRGSMTEPPSVEIPLDDRISVKSRHSSRKSSTSTSSFEDLNTLRLVNATRRDSKHSDHSEHSLENPATVEVGQINTDTTSGTSAVSPLKPRGMLSFKKTSADDQTLQTTSAVTSSGVHSARTNAQTTNSKSTRTKAQKGTKKNTTSYDRDPENVNDIVKISFEEIFAEPEGTYSFGTIWGATYKIFTDSKVWCYKFLSALCGVPCALCWGIHFACLSFCMIWLYQPGIRSFSIQVKPLSKVYSIIVHSFVEPCFAAFGKLFSFINVRTTTEHKEFETL